MADRTVQHLSNKYSSAEIVAKSIKILTVIESHVGDNCEHCQELLENAGLPAQPEHRTRTDTIQTGNLNHEVQESIH